MSETRSDRFPADLECVATARAGRYARMIEKHHFIGVFMSNTRPLMPAPGGTKALTVNNPSASAIQGLIDADDTVGVDVTRLLK